MSTPRARGRVGHSANSNNCREVDRRDGGAHDLLTTKEVAAMFRTSEDTVRYWRHTGTGPEGHRFGRRVLYDRRAVDDWVRSRKEHDAARRR